MKKDPATYRDEDELVNYIWKCYQTAMTSMERAEMNWIIREQKARASSYPKLAKRLRKPIPRWRQKRYQADLDLDSEAHRKEVAERVLADYAEHVFINRCPQCSRIVASPVACTCLWCGESWYERREELVEASTSPFYAYRP